MLAIKLVSCDSVDQDLSFEQLINYVGLNFTNLPCKYCDYTP